MSTITYVQANEENIPAVMVGLRAYLLEFWGPQSPEVLSSLDENHRTYFPEALRQQQCVFWLAYQGDEFVGIGGLIISMRPGTIKNPSGKLGYVFGMYTRPSYRRQGICRSLLQRLEQSATNLGIGMLELHASADGEPVYIGQGYERHQEPTYRKFSW